MPPSRHHYGLLAVLRAAVGELESGKPDMPLVIDGLRAALATAEEREAPRAAHGEAA
jgi:hypothetical protein